MRWSANAIACMVALVPSMPASDVAAQPLSAAIALSKPFYAGGDYGDTRGDWQAELTLRYHFDARFRIGLGAGGGKLDEAYSDPSFSSFWLHVEPSLGGQVSRNLRAWVGARYGWAHERVEDREQGLWAWGWLAGGILGLSYAVREDIGIGVHADVMHLDLRRDEIGAAPSGGLDREGWRLSVGPVLTFGGLGPD
jgi:hypothetical protein